jgi:cytochrome c oxidase assembly factor CtaG
MGRERWMALLFATGSLCFLIGPFPGYAQLVGAEADAATFFAGSILFTGGGAVQTWLAYPERHGTGRGAWWAATVQSAGTLFFNVTTYQALHTSLSDPTYDRLVWRPDALGSICFLISGYLAYVEVAGRLLGRPRRTLESAIATVNLLGCLAFGVSAVASYVMPTTGDERNLAVVNTFTALGALCFLIGAVLMLPEGARGDAAKATTTRRSERS